MRLRAKGKKDKQKTKQGLCTVDNVVKGLWVQLHDVCRGSGSKEQHSKTNKDRRVHHCCSQLKVKKKEERKKEGKENARVEECPVANTDDLQ